MASGKRGRSKEKHVRDRPYLACRSPFLSSNGFRLYFDLLMRAWNDKECYPSQETLARDLGWSVRKVKRVAPELVSLGMVTITKRGSNNCYHLVEHLPRKWFDPARLINATNGAKGPESSPDAEKEGAELSPQRGQNRPPSGDRTVPSQVPGLSPEDERTEAEPPEDELHQEPRARQRSGRGKTSKGPNAVTPREDKSKAQAAANTKVTLKGKQRRPPRHQQRSADGGFVPDAPRKLPESLSSGHKPASQPEFVLPVTPPPRDAKTTWDYFNELLVANGYGRQAETFDNLPKIWKTRLKGLVQRYGDEHETFAHMLQVLVRDWQEIRESLAGATRHPADPVRSEPDPVLYIFLMGKDENVEAYINRWAAWARGRKPDPVRRQKERTVDVARGSWKHTPKFKPDEGAE